MPQGLLLLFMLSLGWGWRLALAQEPLLPEDNLSLLTAGNYPLAQTFECSSCAIER